MSQKPQQDSKYWQLKSLFSQSIKFFFLKPCSQFWWCALFGMEIKQKVIWPLTWLCKCEWNCKYDSRYYWRAWIVKAASADICQVRCLFVVGSVPPSTTLINHGDRYYLIKRTDFDASWAEAEKTVSPYTHKLSHTWTLSADISKGYFLVLSFGTCRFKLKGAL